MCIGVAKRISDIEMEAVPYLTTHARNCGRIPNRGLGQGHKTTGIKCGRHGRRTVLRATLALTPRNNQRAISLPCGIQRIARICGGADIESAGIADLPGDPPEPRIDACAVGGILMAHVGAESEMAMIAQCKTLTAPHIEGCAVALAGNTCL